VFLLRYYHRAASNRKICFVRRVMNGARKKVREKACIWVAAVHAGGIGRLLPALGMENLSMTVPWLRGRDHNLYNGLAKVYPESRFYEKTGWRMEGNRPFPFVAACYGRCIIIAPQPPSLSQPISSSATFPVAFYSQCTRIRACTIANKAIRRPA